jgi:hypothetical protein
MKLQAKLLRKRSSLRPFSHDDWYLWQGASELPDGSGPYIAYIKCIDFPSDLQEALIVLGGSEDDETGAVINLSSANDTEEAEKYNGWAMFDNQEEAMRVAERLANEGLTYTEAVKLFELPYLPDQDRREGLMHLDDDALLERYQKKESSAKFASVSIADVSKVINEHVYYTGPVTNERVHSINWVYNQLELLGVKDPEGVVAFLSRRGLVKPWRGQFGIAYLKSEDMASLVSKLGEKGILQLQEMLK